MNVNHWAVSTVDANFARVNILTAHHTMKKYQFLLSLLVLPMAVNGQDEVLSSAIKTNDYFMAKYADPTEPTNVKRIRPSNLWTRAVYYEGLMALNDVAPDDRYIDYTDRWGDFHQWTPRYGVTTTHADDQCCAQTYLDRYAATGDTARVNKVKQNLDLQIKSGRVDYWTWIDAIQMAMPVYSKYYKLSGDRRYMDYAMNAYTWSRDTCGGGLFNEQEGLWWRDKDYVPPYKESDGKNCYWSRGNGWVYAALVRVMEDLDPNDPYYKSLNRDFVLMSKALLDCQRKDGYWNVSLVSPVTYGGPEMTGTALFLYGMSRGIMEGWLDAETYRPACDKAWKALEACVHDNGFLGYNQGTGKDPSAGQPVTFTSVPDFEDYGTGCFLLGATEYYKLLLSEKTPMWPPAKPEARAGTRWWWPGSAVDKDNISWNLDLLAAAGIGTVEITPIYGAIGNDDNAIEYLSPEWMKMLDYTISMAAQRRIKVDMNNGTGWPFGGPDVTIKDAACKAIFRDTIIYAKSINPSDVTLTLPEKEKSAAVLQYTGVYPAGKDRWLVIALYTAPTMQKVKRAAPGGEGLVIDHFSSEAVTHYLERFDKAFDLSGVAYPATFFNDSYEVYGANWTPSLFDEFASRRHYRLEEHLPELLGLIDDGNKVLADYRETLGDLLYENFTCLWHDWANRHGVKVRNQAHGSPANLLDIYGAVDIPEIEGFGLSEFNIAGLRTDSGHVRKNDSDVSMLKYASSAAHVTGKPFTSSETFTWLTEHFRTSLSQMKPDLDLMFTCGVNRVFFHGTCYSPRGEEWPGWRFYASVDMSPANSIWRDAPYLMKYIERCQSYLQYGNPDNDFLVYLPVRDMWHTRLKEGDKGLLMQFDIHSMDRKAPSFIKSILAIDSLGYDCDYISDHQLACTKMAGNRLITEGGASYKGIIIPSGTTITAKLKNMLASFGNLVIFGEDETALATLASAEEMKLGTGLRAIRRKNPTGHHYFIANLSANDVNGWYKPSVTFTDAAWFNPLNGDIIPADIKDGKVRLDMRSGESMILRTYTSPLSAERKQIDTLPEKVIDLTGNSWLLSFTDEHPEVANDFTLPSLRTWESLDSVTAVTAGTGVYTTSFNIDKADSGRRWSIDLGDVRESARVYLNDKFIGCAWSAPFVLDCDDNMHAGTNTLKIEVTNLPANRIADLDRHGVEWRKMKEINVVDINYKKTRYDNWQPVKSGLNSTVKLISKN